MANAHFAKQPTVCPKAQSPMRDKSVISVMQVGRLRGEQHVKMLDAERKD